MEFSAAPRDRNMASAISRSERPSEQRGDLPYSASTSLVAWAMRVVDASTLGRLSPTTGTSSGEALRCPGWWWFRRERVRASGRGLVWGRFETATGVVCSPATSVPGGKRPGQRPGALHLDLPGA